MLGLACLVAAPSQLHAVEPKLAGVANPARAHTNYMLNCQGCHGPDGSGSRDGAVPVMKNFVGQFLQVPGGREYLVQVPGSANAAIPDDQLAELLNWLLPRLSDAEMPANFKPFTAPEVERLRAVPEADVGGTRARLIEAIAKRAQGRLFP